MKKVLLILLAAVALVGCNGGKDEPMATRRVVMRVQGLEVLTQPMAAPLRKADATPTDAGLTDLWLFEGTELLAHQTSADADFGSPELELTYGQHSITIIGSSTTDQSFTNGVWAGKDPKDCFGAVHNVNVTSTTGEQAVVLTRCYYALQWQSEDKVPANAATVEVTVGNYRKTLLGGLAGGEVVAKNINASVASYIGKTVTVSAYGFAAAYGTEETIHTTYTIKDASKNVIHKHEKDVPVLSGRATIIKGSMFGTPASAAVMVDNKALTNYEVSL